MSSSQFQRRMFLRGVGGAVLAIPFLPSLHKRAFAADPTLGPVAKRFFALRTGHGGVWHSDFFPDESMLTGAPLNYAGRDVRWGALPTAANEEGRVHWSGVCNANANLLTPALASKFNILKGIDISRSAICSTASIRDLSVLKGLASGRGV